MVMKRFILFFTLFFALNNTNKADCYNGFEYLGEVNTFAVTQSYGNWICSYELSVMIYRDCTHNPRLWVKNGTGYSLIFNNRSRTYMGYDVSSYRYCADSFGWVHFFN